MILIFPAAGILFALMDFIFNRPYSIGLFPGIIINAVIYTLLAVLCYVVFLLVLAFLVNTDKPNEKFSRFYSNVISFTLKLALEACNVKVTVKGEDKIPSGHFVLVQNHKAMFDPMVSLAYLGKYDLGFITKPENTHLPIINKYMHRICCIPIDRENPRNAVKSINAASDNVKNGICSMAIYPEGTRARDGEMLPFHAGSFKIATKSGAPLVITTVSNTNLVHKNAPFKRTHITLDICDVVPAEEVASSSTAELAERARKAMCASLDIPYSE